MEDPRYPIGKFSFESSSPERIEGWIQEIERAPSQLIEAVQGLSESQLDTPYREGGWTVRQVVHHVVDSHMNSYVRFRWTLTEDAPVIKAYDEQAWAELNDAKTAPIELSLRLLEALHERWVVFFRGLSSADFEKVFEHPQTGQAIPLDRNLALYAWHGKHHIGHILALKKREGWS